MINTIDLSMRFGGKILFKNVSIQLNSGNRYGLIGANGAGKSTFLKILMGDISSESGKVSLPSSCCIATLKQDHYLYSDTKILDVVMMGNKALWEAFNTQKELLASEEFDENVCDSLSEIEKIIAALDGYTAESFAARLLEGLGLPEKIHAQPLKTLSGGYKLRVLLAQLLFSKPDILLLDEPTNHLDLYSIKWLEDYLKSFQGTLLISSHDRNFLNGVCTHILDLDHETIKIYKGNFEDFLEQKAFLLEQAALQSEKQEKKKEHLTHFIERFGAKATKARQAQSKMKLVEKLEAELTASEIAPTCRRYPSLTFTQCRPSGAKVLTVKLLNKSYGEKHVLNDISLDIQKGDRVAILGINGIGKSTFLEIIAGSIPADAGSYEWGFATYPSYFPQDHSKHVNGSLTVLEWLARSAPGIQEEKLRNILGKVLFSGDDVNKSVTILSGGEAARLLLARSMVIDNNVLIFDEPTNHLDMESEDALCEALNNYEGTIIFVSHNRHFVSKVANRIIEFTSKEVLDYKCTFAEYLEKREEDLLQAQKRPKEHKDKAGKINFQEHKQQQKNRNQSLKKIQLAEEKCHKLENQIKEIESLFLQDGYFQRTSKADVDALNIKKQDLEKRLEVALIEWEQASIQ